MKLRALMNFVIALQMLLNRLKINFPTVDNTSLFEVLQSNNFSYRYALVPYFKHLFCDLGAFTSIESEDLAEQFLHRQDSFVDFMWWLLEPVYSCWALDCRAKELDFWGGGRMFLLARWIEGLHFILESLLLKQSSRKWKQTRKLDQ
jgi:hypothetical protein